MTAIRLWEPNDSSSQVSELVSWHLARRKPGSAKADKEIRRVLGLFADFCGNQSIDTLSGDDLLRFLSSQHNDWTRKRWSTTVKAMFANAVCLGRLDRNPFVAVRLPKGDQGRDLTQSEFAAALRVSTAAFRRVLIMLRHTGLRPGELLALEWDQHIRLSKNPSIVLRQHKTSKKTGKPRVIPLVGVALRLVLWIRAHCRGQRVFLNSYGTPWRTRTLCDNMATVRRRANLPDDAKLYGCRHAFGTAAVLAGVDVLTLAELMGHTQLETTRWYVHLSGKTDHLVDAMERASRSARD